MARDEISATSYTARQFVPPLGGNLMGTDDQPMLRRLWAAHLEAAFAAWRIFDGLVSRSLDACGVPRGHRTEDCEHLVQSETVARIVRGERFTKAEEAIGALALGLRGGKVKRLEAMIEAIDGLREERSSDQRPLERPSCRSAITSSPSAGTARLVSAPATEHARA